ncbi:DUF2087 domain-containing protein [Gracilibacillus pellucidus]
MGAFPSKEKRNLIVLQTIKSHFASNKIYSEKQVNGIQDKKIRWGIHDEC